MAANRRHQRVSSRVDSPSSRFTAAAFALVVGASACSPSNDAITVTPPGAGGAGGATGTGGGATGGSAINTGGGGTGGSANGTGGTVGTGGAGTGGTSVMPPIDGGGGIDASVEAGQTEGSVEASLCPNGGDPTLDSDGDHVPDCIDGCPFDVAKTAPLFCGCNVPEVPDTDNDGVPDCVDPCPRDIMKQVAGACGCLDIVGDPLCLAHRYSFDGATGTAVVTDTGHAPTLVNGAVINATLVGNGTVVLAGGVTGAAAQYVALPSGIVSTMGNSATFEAWVTWNPANVAAPPNWQRVFDFGASNAANGNGQGYWMMTTRAGTTNGLRAALSVTGSLDFNAEDLIDSQPATLPTGVITHVAVVIDGGVASLDGGGAPTGTMRLYENGAPMPVGSMGAAIRLGATLSMVPDVNNWLGRSQYAADQSFAGILHEFRIYSRALTAAQILADSAAGPDMLPAAL